MGDWVIYARLDHMEQIVAVAIASAAAVLFALMAWAGQHQS